MKIPNIARQLSGVFRLGRIASFILAGFGLLWLTLSFLPKADHPTFPIPVNVNLKLTSGALSIESKTPNSTELRLHQFSSVVLLNPRSPNLELTKAIRYAILPSLLMSSLAGWLICTLLRNICARVERGEIFSDANLRGIRNVGLALLISPLCNGALELWSRLWLNRYLPTDIKVTGIAATLQFKNSDWGSFFTDLITGFLVLLVAEAFRQGLALKKENDLTV